MTRYISTPELLRQQALTYQQILNLKRRMSGYAKQSPEHKRATLLAVWNDKQREEYNLTPEHTAKGISWLRKIAFKPSHYAKHNWDKDCCERINSPFGFVGVDIIRHFDHFTFAGFHETTSYYQARAGYRQLYPVWRCYDRQGRSFAYYVEGGKPEFI